MRIIVCGGRYYEEWKTVSRALKEAAPTVLIQGGASGADKLAMKWAEINGIPVVTYPASWRVGKKGGPMRNAFMLQDSRADLVIAFPGGRGTRDMVGRAKAAGVPVREIGG